jgi:tetratricopeptide (TPR) repeat protein
VRAADQDPQEVAYVVAIVQAMLQLGEAEDALALLESYEPEFGWTSAYHAALAECCEQLGDWARAASAWQKVVDANDDSGIRERLATALYRAERWSQAIPHLQRLLDEPETRAAVPLRLALAECLLEDRQPDAARDQISFVLRDDPRDVMALRLMARAYVECGQLERARRVAEQALQFAPDELPSVELAAVLALRTGESARASRLAHQIEQSFPAADSPVARQILRRLSPPPPGIEQ